MNFHRRLLSRSIVLKNVLEYRRRNLNHLCYAATSSSKYLFCIHIFLVVLRDVLVFLKELKRFFQLQKIYILYFLILFFQLNLVVCYNFLNILV